MTRIIRPRSIDDFCLRRGISRSMFYKGAKRGLMPRVTKIGSLSRILEEDEAAWVEAQRDIKSPTEQQHEAA